MKNSKFAILFLCLGVLAVGYFPASANHLVAPGKKQGNYAGDLYEDAELPLYIDNVHIVDVSSGEIIPNRQLQIRNGKITAIQAAGAGIADDKYSHHDAKGQYVTPGLIDMHVHAYDPAAFTIALSHGVTHMRLMNGVEEHITWRQELAEGSRIGSTITVSSPIISGFKQAHMHYSAQTPAEATDAVIRAKQQDYDLIKAYGNLTAPVFAALLNEARTHGIPVARHGPHPADGMEWSDLSGLQSLEHVEDIYQGPLNYSQDQKKLDATIFALKDLNIPITPTLNIFWQLTQISDRKQAYINALPEGYISPIIALEEKHNQVKRWLKSSDGMAKHNKETLVFLQEITRQLYEAKLTLLVGSDAGVLLSPHGIATHTEMRLMRQAGLPASAVLRAATINPAKALGKESQLGKIEVGFFADMILSEINPLENLATLKDPIGVVKGGHLFSRIELEQLRRKAIEDRSIWQELQTLRKAG